MTGRMVTVTYPSGTCTERYPCEVMIDATEVSLYRSNGNWDVHVLVRRGEGTVEIGDYVRTDYYS